MTTAAQTHGDRRTRTGQPPVVSVRELPSCELWPVAMLGEAGRPDLNRVAQLRIGRVRTVVVLAAHFGEELCAAGGLLATLAAARARVQVLTITDGSNAASPARPLSQRHATDAGMYHLLGLDPTDRYRLGLRAGAVDTDGDVLAAISELLGFADPTGLLCLAPWTGDSHPDHGAVGHAATLACHAYGARLLHYSITQWCPPQHSRSCELTTRPDTAYPDIPLHRASRFALPEPVATRKCQAIDSLIRSPRPGRSPRWATPTNSLGQACEVFIDSAQTHDSHDPRLDHRLVR